MTKRKEYLRKYMRKYRKAKGEPSKQGYRHRLRTQVMTLLGGPICANCKCDNVKILEINHINGGGRKDAKDLTKLFRDILAARRKKSEFNILCKPCNTLHYVTDILGIKGHKIIWSPAGVVQQ